MIKLIFTYNRELMSFIIKDREIFYSDRKFSPKSWVRCIPPPENFMKLVASSRNRIPAYLINMFKYTDEEIKEYEAAKTEQELADIIIRDAKGKGCIFIKQVNELVVEDQKKSVIA